jgi:hypothetical protein
VSLSQQVQALIDHAPTDLQQPIAQIAPILQQVAGDLAHQSYFIGQSHNQEWIVITLENRQQVQRQSIYAFSQQQDVLQFYGPAEMAIELPVIDLLFQLFALDAIDQLIFFDQPGNFETGRTVSRAAVQKAIEQQLQPNQTLPPDIC